jgi:hypothetical protein
MIKIYILFLTNKRLVKLIFISLLNLGWSLLGMSITLKAWLAFWVTGSFAYEIPRYAVGSFV